MVYKGERLLLDTYRKVLKDFTVDIQDIVRSAILDGTDRLALYLDSCSNDPYKLEQIRLCLKEGKSFDSRWSGKTMYQVRDFLRTSTVDLLEFEHQMRYTLSDEHVSYLLKWLGSGISLKGLNVSTIPESLLEIFDMGLFMGVNMCKYNTGVVYPSDILSILVKIDSNEQPVDKFLNGEWNKSVLHTFAIHSSNKIGGYIKVYNAVSEKDTYQRVDGLLGIYCSSLWKGQVGIDRLQAKDSFGNYLYNDNCISLIQRAVYNNLDIEKVLAVTNEIEMEKVIGV